MKRIKFNQKDINPYFRDKGGMLIPNDTPYNSNREWITPFGLLNMGHTEDVPTLTRSEYEEAVMNGKSFVVVKGDSEDIGDIIQHDRDDSTPCPYFRNSKEVRIARRISNIGIAEGFAFQSPYIVGNKFRYIGDCDFKHGEILTLIANDNTTTSEYRGEGGHEKWIDNEFVEPLDSPKSYSSSSLISAGIDGTVFTVKKKNQDITRMNPDTKYYEMPLVYPEDTRRPDAEEGEQYIVIRYHSNFSFGEIVTLFRNDKSTCPYFVSDRVIGMTPVSWHKLAPVNTTSVAKSELDGQLAKVKKQVILQGTYV